jgi:AhpD family alkylhydroperoxidase
MTRLAALTPAEQTPFVKLSRRLARRKFKQLTGTETATMLAPLDAYARAPRLLFGIAMLEEATAKLRRVPERLKVLAELKAATLTQCEYCIDIGSHIAYRAGVSEEQLLALPRYRESPLFSDDEKLVLDYAVGVSSTPVSVSDELFERLRARFDESQVVELTNIIALENMRGRFNLALGMGSSGFREGMVCAAPTAGAADADTGAAAARADAATTAGAAGTPDNGIATATA